jgi:hypothetical protein
MEYNVSGGGTMQVTKYVAGTGTTLNTYTAVGTSPTPRIRFEVEGTTLRGFLNGVQKFSFTDAAIGSGNYSGIRIDGAGNTLDNMTCGSL